MPLAGLLRDGPPEARLRIRCCACICHRQRLAPDPRKATRGSVLWTPRESGESKGGTRVAARAVRRGRCARVSLTLNRTSDRDSTTLFPAAHGLRSRQHCGRRGNPAWTLHQTCTRLDIRVCNLTLCKMLPAFSALFFWPGRGPSSFRARSKRRWGAHCVRCHL